MSEYARTSATLRLAVPLLEGSWRVGLEAAGGTAWGRLPLQREWFLGGASTLRGYDASVLTGSTFARGRMELAQVRSRAAYSWVVFGDVGWAGERRDFREAEPLYCAGVGVSVMDGLIRMDLSQGLRGPDKRLRFDLYLDALF